MNIAVVFDWEVAQLLMPDMCLIGTFDKLSDDSWCACETRGAVRCPRIPTLKGLHWLER